MALVTIADFGFGPDTWPSVVKMELHFVATIETGELPPRTLIESLRCDHFRRRQRSGDRRRFVGRRAPFHDVWK